MGDYEIKYQKVIEKNGRVYTKNSLVENGLMYLYKAFEINVINASTTYTN